MKFNLNLDSINYIKIVYKSDDEKTRCTKAAIKRMGEHEIFACAKTENGLNLKTPQDVLLSFVCDNGLYRTTTNLKFIEKEDPYVFFTLKTPEGIEYQQNREYFRVRITEDAILSYKSGDRMVRIPCKTHDISANGVRVILSEKIQNLDNASINILFEPVNIKSKVKFVRFDDEDGIPKASFQFVDLPENEVDLISQKCIQKQLEYRRNSVM